MPIIKLYHKTKSKNICQEVKNIFNSSKKYIDKLPTIYKKFFLNFDTTYSAIRLE